ncbi:MAG: helix-turn-helix domain-containing protein [Candidatus Bathyarchaeia archaeon]
MEDESSRFFTMLGHPTRREIVRVIGEKGAASFTELKASLQVSVGTLYYNLDLLKGLVAQRQDRRYILTTKGQVAYKLLVESEEKIASQSITAVPVESPARGFLRAVMAWRLFSYLYADPKLAAPSALTILAYGAWITYQAGLLPILMLYSDKPAVEPLIAPIAFLGGWLALNLLANGLTYALYRSSEGAPSLLVGSCYALLPSLLLPTLWALSKALFLPLDLITVRLVMFASMGYSLLLLTSAVGMAKGLSLEKAAVVTVAALYATIGLALLVFLF